MKGFTLEDEGNFKGTSSTKFTVRRIGSLCPLMLAMVSINFFVLFLVKRDKTKTEYIPKLSFLNTGKGTFNIILSEACEYDVWKIATPGIEVSKLAETTKQLQLPPANDLVNHIMAIVYDIINIEKTTLSLKEKAMAKWYKGISKPK